MMASNPSPPADPLQARNSDDHPTPRRPIIPNPTNCKLYELIATPDEDSDVKKHCVDSESTSSDTSVVKILDPSGVRLDGNADGSGNGGQYDSGLHGCLHSRKYGRKRRGDDRHETKSESHYHPYAESIGRDTKHRPAVKSCFDLRSTAPVLYDLLCDDCESENQDRSTNVSRNALPEPNYYTPPEHSLRPLTIQMPFASSPGLPVLPNINQLPASYISTLLQQNLFQTYPTVNFLKTTQAPSYLEDLPSVTPILPSVLRDVLALEDEPKKPMPLL